jgi:hypothetical protein
MADRSLRAAARYLYNFNERPEGLRTVKNITMLYQTLNRESELNSDSDSKLSGFCGNIKIESQFLKVY